VAADPPFDSIAVIGLGLIGGSIALAVRERWPQSRVFGVDSESVLAHAVGAGAIERGFGNLNALPDASLIVLAAPVNQNIELLNELAGRKGLAGPRGPGGGQSNPQNHYNLKKINLRPKIMCLYMLLAV
jgi:hypothetical protein